MTEAPVLNILALAALGLMVTVTGGVLYLTLAEWRDRRRQDRDRREQRTRGPKKR